MRSSCVGQRQDSYRRTQDQTSHCVRGKPWLLYTDYKSPSLGKWSGLNCIQTFDPLPVCERKAKGSVCVRYWRLNQGPSQWAKSPALLQNFETGLTLWFSWLILPSATITGVHHHAQLWSSWVRCKQAGLWARLPSPASHQSVTWPWTAELLCAMVLHW